MPKKGCSISEEQRRKIIETKKRCHANGYYKKKRKCLFCKNSLHYSQTKFCSLECKGAFFSGPEHPLFIHGRSLKTKKCKYCNTPIKPSNKSNACRPCLRKYMKTKQHPAWRGGSSKSTCIDCGKSIGGGSKRCRKCFRIFNKGNNNPMFGQRGLETNRWNEKKKNNSCEVCKKDLGRRSRSSVCMDCYTGPHTPNWEGGISCLPYGKEWTARLRRQIKKRDGQSCQNPWCSKKNKTLSVHHIDYNKQNCDPSNLITLCRSCNTKANKNRSFWTLLYSTIMQRRFGGGKENLVKCQSNARAKRIIHK